MGVGAKWHRIREQIAGEQDLLGGQKNCNVTGSVTRKMEKAQLAPAVEQRQGIAKCHGRQFGRRRLEFGKKPSSQSQLRMQLGAILWCELVSVRCAAGFKFLIVLSVGLRCLK